MKTLTDYEHDYVERIGIITEDGISEELAQVTATYQVRQDMANDGLEFGAANMKVMGMRNRDGKGVKELPQR